MRIGPIGFIGRAVLALTLATFGCSSSSGPGGGGPVQGSGGHPGGGSGGATGSGGSSGSGGARGSGGATGSGGGGASVTTLSGSKTIGTLSASEATQLCNDSYSYFGTAIPKTTTCKWKALAYAASSSPPTEAILKQNCMTQQTSCQQGGDPWATNNGCNDLPSDCTATVAQYSACIADEVTAFVQAVNGLAECSALTFSGTSAITDAQGATPPASCGSLMDACPALYPPGPFN